ncbi:uncharacterized protein PG998_004447 [Apiospora kogelbergensis]|uniref:uncharacterized protein n=1 Tax=Apiospora kogelbergensis TaxID=1337665 RepID=UPI003131D8E5
MTWSLRSLAPLALACLLSDQAAAQQKPLTDFNPDDACPDYKSYSTYPHRPLSEGPLALPFQRPHPRCRTFHSDAIEKVIEDVTSRMKDPDLARLFENAFPSTTDTTVKFHTTGADGKKKKKKPNTYSPSDSGKWDGPQSFIITGDIIAEWLRDSTNQLSPYQPLAKKDPAVYQLILGAINTQSEFVIESPYCNAFQPPPISGLPVSHNGQEDQVHPAYEPSAVFECKYELDSLAHFLALSNDFNDHTGSRDHLTTRWFLALETVFTVLEQQSRPTFDAETGRYERNEYTFQRNTNSGTETLNLNGVGNPLANGTGLVRSAFRPSDDAATLGFFIPANAMMAVELKRAANILKEAGESTWARRADKWSRTIAEGVWEHGVVHHKKFGDVFAYEVDGYGSALFMDDANYPSLLALPLMGPHIGLSNAWPMSLLVQAQTSNSDTEIKECLALVLKASKLGLIHESVDVNNVGSYTRSWFAWANGVFAETILDIAKRKPHLIFKNNKPYEI